MKSSGYFFHMKTKILTDFQICFSVLWWPIAANQKNKNNKNNKK